MLKMVRLSQTNPSEYDHYIFEQRENAGISSTHAHDHNRFLIATGIEVSKMLMEQTAVVQFPPAIVYNRGYQKIFPEIDIQMSISKIKYVRLYGPLKMGVM